MTTAPCCGLTTRRRGRIQAPVAICYRIAGHVKQAAKEVKGIRPGTFWFCRGFLLAGGPLGMTKDWKTRTQLVHEGSRRSQYGEMAEAIFLTQGFVYPTAEAAEARFVKAGADEFIYARYGNPTTRMFEERIAALEGTEDAFATASGMAAVSGALMSCLRAGDQWCRRARSSGRAFTCWKRCCRSSA
jgi:Cys/Met metabolism PLP-dependent enzyme